MTIVNPRKLEHSFRRIGAGIPYTLLSGHEANDVPTFWLLLEGVRVVGFQGFGVWGLQGLGTSGLRLRV